MEEIRKTGIDIIGDAPWGTHFCQFYQTKEDLIDVLVPYFKAGLENNEFCMWVTSEPLSEKEAEKAMGKAVSNFDRYLKRGQIEIVPHTEWYLKEGAFHLQRVLNAWVDKLNQALAEGYDGIRVTGNTAWLEKRDWRSFADYEEEVNDAIGKYRMMAICTYSLDKCGASEVIDVVRNHQFALIRRRGEWELTESSELKRAKEALRESGERYHRLVELSPDAIAVHSEGKIVFINNAGAKLLGAANPEQVIGKTIMDFVHPDYREIIKERLQQVRGEGTKVPRIEEKLIRLDGTDVDAEVAAIPFTYQGKPAVMAIARDITERKQAEEALLESEKKFRLAFENAKDAIFWADPETGFIINCNKAAETLLGKKRGEIIDHHQTTLHPPQKAEYYAEMFKRHIEQEGAVDDEAEVITKSGKIKPVHITASTTLVAGKPITQGIFRDITERKRMERELRKSEERFRTSVENMLDCFGIYSAIRDQWGRIVDFRVEYVNAAACANNRMSKEEQIGKRLLELLPAHRETGLFDKYCQVVEMGKPLIKETLIYEDVYKGQRLKRAFDIRAVKLGDGFAAAWRNVTERKKAEEALRRSEEQARRLLEFQNKVIDTADVWIDLLDVEENVTLWNRAAELISGYSREEVIGNPKIWEWLYPDPKYRAKIFAQGKRIIEKGERMENDETTIRCKDGTFKTIRWYSNNILDEKGKPVGLISVGIDITERKMAEEKLRESEERFRNLFESAGDGILTLDLRGRVTSANKKIEEISGLSREEIIGKGPTQFVRMGIIGPKDIPLILKALTTRIKGQPPKVYEFRIKNKKGQEKFIEFRGSLIKQRGKPIGILEIIRDVTERKMMEEKLRQYSEHLEELVQQRTEELLESEKRYSVLVEEASDGVIIYQDYKIVFSNKRGAGIVGYSTDEMIGLPFEKIVDEKYRQYSKERYERRIRGETVPATAEVELIAKTGERVPVEVSATRIHYQGRPAALVIVRDVRERKRMEEERLKLERLAAIGEAAAMVGHDLRNPLQAIVNTLYLAKEKLKSIPVTDRKIVEKHGFSEWGKTLEEQVEYMNKIVSDLQDYARPVKPEPVETSLPQLINDALSTITLPENVKVSKVVPEDFPKLMVDPPLMRRVLTNLVTNALQAMPEGGQLTIRPSKTEETAFISVQDTGVGIPEEDLLKLFQPLFTTKSKGQGFGLPVCKRLVEAHDGSITVKSEAGRGSTFTVKIPLRRGVS